MIFVVIVLWSLSSKGGFKLNWWGNVILNLVNCRFFYLLVLFREVELLRDFLLGADWELEVLLPISTT